MTYRTLNHYDEIGILIHNRQKKRGWRKFTGVEVVWIQIIKAMRRFGMSLPNMLHAKEEIVKDMIPFPDTESGYSEFTERMAICLKSSSPMYILITPDGKVSYLTKKDNAWSKAFKTNQEFIAIPLSKIVREVYDKLG